MRNLWQTRVNTFLSVWNKLRRSLDTSGECVVYPVVITGMEGLGGHLIQGEGRMVLHYPLAIQAPSSIDSEICILKADFRHQGVDEWYGCKGGTLFPLPILSPAPTHRPLILRLSCKNSCALVPSSYCTSYPNLPDDWLPVPARERELRLSSYGPDIKGFSALLQVKLSFP